MRPLLCSLSLAFAFALALASRSASAQQQPASGMSAGGLAPPPAVEAAPVEAPPTATEQELARADREDSGRGLQFVWLNAEAGLQHLGLHTFHENKLVDSDAVKSTQTGPVFGAGAGVRLIFLTAGARFRFASFSAFQLWTLNAEFGLRIPLGALEPYFTFGGGYASLGAFDGSSALSEAGIDKGGLSAHGFDLRGGAGFDYYLGKTLSVGANLSGDLLFLSRAKQASTETPAPGSQAERVAAVYAEKGTGIGGALSLTALIGLHF
jgi:hypothetical protein